MLWSEFSRRTGSIPSHQCPWYWLCRINSPLFSKRKEFNYMNSFSLIFLCFLNTLRPRQNCCCFTDIFKCIFFNENVCISLKISLKVVSKVWINNIPALIQILAWCQPGDKPLSEPMMVSSLTHICVIRPQWVKQFSTHWADSTRHRGPLLPTWFNFNPSIDK